MMSHRARRLGVLTATTLFGLAVSVAPILAAGDPDPRPAPPPSGGATKGSDQKNTKKKKNDQRSQQEFIDGYHAARALVLDGKYEEGLAAFKALGHDEDSAEVANYIGYANRKLGNYELAKVWYDKALSIDPKHVRTWQYYGMWHVEQGNMLKANEYLETIRLICGGTGCQEFQDLKGAIEGRTSY